jgi:hypothetical protein
MKAQSVALAPIFHRSQFTRSADSRLEWPFISQCAKAVAFIIYIQFWRTSGDFLPICWSPQSPQGEKRKKDPIREDRIHNEAIVDAYGPEE